MDSVLSTYNQNADGVKSMSKEADLFPLGYCKALSHPFTEHIHVGLQQIPEYFYEWVISPPLSNKNVCFAVFYFTVVSWCENVTRSVQALSLGANYNLPMEESPPKEALDLLCLCPPKSWTLCAKWHTLWYIIWYQIHNTCQLHFGCADSSLPPLLILWGQMISPPFDFPMSGLGGGCHVPTALHEKHFEKGLGGSAHVLLLLLSTGKSKLNCQKWNCPVINKAMASHVLQHQTYF